MQLSDNKRIAFNSVVIMVRLIVFTIISIFTSRIVLDALGAKDYGLYNVVGGIVAILNVLNSSMIATTYRFIAFELGKGALGDSRKVFNTSLTIHVFFALIILLFGTILGLFYINNFLNVDLAKLDDARFVFIISIITTAISTILVPFQGLLVAYEKFSVQAIIDIITVSVKFALILALIYVIPNRLRTYSLIMFTYTMLSGLLYYKYSRNHYYKIIKLKVYKDWTLFKNMFSYATWSLYADIALLGSGQIGVMLINYFFGTIVNAAFGVAKQVENFVLMFSGNLSKAAVPQITKSLSSGDKTRSIKLTCYISKYTYILMIIVAFPVILEMQFLLGIWLKEVPEQTTIFCNLLLLNGLLSCLGAGIPSFVGACGNIRNYQLTLYTFQFVQIPIVWFLFYHGYPAYTFVIVTCVVTLLSDIIKLLLLKYMYLVDIGEFFKISYWRVFVMSLPLLVIFFLYDTTNYPGIFHIGGLALIEMVIMVDILLLGLSKKERSIVIGIIKRKIRGNDKSDN